MNDNPVSPRIDVAFRLDGKRVPRDHGHALFGAVARVLGDLHGAQWLAIHPLHGEPGPDDTILIAPRRSSLRLRIEPAEITRVLPLSGKRIEVNGHALLVGVSTVYALSPARALLSRMVTIKGFQEPEPFREAAARQLAELGVAARVEVGRRRVLRVNDKTVVGFGVTLHDLTEEGSLRVQYAGLGGKQRMGCGIFIPVGGRR
jgi:CRISPR-associated endonuclease/helicase Cas3